MTDRKLIVTTIDLPYPPNHGHKVDQYNRWRGFADRGWRLRLICWRAPKDPPLSDGDVAALGDVFEKIDILPIRHDMGSFARRLLNLPRYPSHVSARIPDAATLACLTAEARDFGPAAVVLDGIYGGYVGEYLARACGVPVVLRGHNIEYLYFGQQARAVTDARSKFAWTIARLGLARYERALVRRAAWTFDVSADDVAFWKDQGIETVSWAPTVYPGAAHGTIIPAAERRWDVAYIGNMRLPNNLRGLTWFVRKVLPELRRIRPGLSLCFAGANPNEEACALMAEAPEITLIPNVPSADDILANGRVLVNPILSGSGINIKSIDMLRYDAPVVTTHIGAQGFPAALRDQFVIREDAAGFAKAIAECLDAPVPPPGRAEARALFGETGLDEQVAAYARLAGLSED